MRIGMPSPRRPWRFPSLIAVIMVLLSVVACELRSPAVDKLRPGDLLFHVVKESNAITDVTPGMIDHVAIVVTTDSVIEAVPKSGVHIVPVDTLLQDDGYWIHSRVKTVDAHQSIARARRYLGLPYDSLFLPDNRAVYCSELVQVSFVDSQGKLLFEPVPMSFHDGSGQILPYWEAFYARQGMDVPEGWPGTNPGELSKRPIVVIVSDSLK